jgi:hypothetical protein
LVLGCIAVGLLLAAPAPAKTLNRAVLVGADGAWVRVAGSTVDFDNLARDPASKPRRTTGSYVRLYFVGPGDFPANRARYYPGQRCIALDWPTYQRSCVAVNLKLTSLFRRSHRLARFTERPTVLARLRYTSSRGSSPELAGLTGSVELAVLRAGVARSAPAGCYALAGTWKGPAAADRPKELSLCGNGVYAGGRLHPLNRGVWEWFRRNVGPPETAPEPPIAEQPTLCTAGEVESLVRRFIDAFNTGDLGVLDALFAREPDFEWYSTDAPGERFTPLANDRPSLVPYVAGRSARGEQLTLRSFRFNANSSRPLRPYGNFEYGLTRSADDLQPTPYYGKGAAFCYGTWPDVIFVWSMGRQ